MTKEQPVAIPLDPGFIAGSLTVPEQSRGAVVFAHGSGSSRHSPRNRQVAARLQRDGFATLLMDLLTPQEEAVDAHTAELRFDIDLLADRLVRAVAWLDGQPNLRDLRLGYFGASTGAAGALVAAARQGARVGAIVSRGGRPDLAGDALSVVRAPTLLLVGERDELVLNLNKEASRRLRCEHRIEVVPRATHLFEEPGALDLVARLAAAWFSKHLSAHDAPSSTRPL